MFNHDAVTALPAHQDTPAAWYGPQLAARDDWIEALSDSELFELERASDRLATTNADLTGLRATDHPLPILTSRLRRALSDVLDGRGFVLLRGLPVQAWGRRRAAIAFMLLGAHLGHARPQNALGHLLGHVRDMGLRSDDPKVRIYQTHERQTYHTDSCDVVALLCLQTARTGGQSALVSSTTVFNEMRRHRPDLAAALFQPLATDRRGEVGPGQEPFFTIPVFNWLAQGGTSQLSVIYQRQYLESAQRFEGAPRITPQIREALDLFDSLCNDPRLNLHMDLRIGDIQLVHNHTLLHDRTGFEDWPEPERRRHLLRLWLAPEQARVLPQVFARRYGSIVAGARGGVGLPDTALQVPLDGL